MFTDEGGANYAYTNDEDKTYIICPDDPACEKTEVTFTAFDIEDETNCGYDVLTAYDGNGTGGTNLGAFCGTNSPGTLTSTDASGCLTFVFTSDGSVTAAGWEAAITCVDNGACGGCPDDYAGINALSGNENGTADYETDGSIESTQIIGANAVVDYDSQMDITLNPGFETIVGAIFEAFIDGCNDGAGGSVSLTEGENDAAKKTNLTTTKLDKTNASLKKEDKK